jgi:hypothetical protein
MVKWLGKATSETDTCLVGNKTRRETAVDERDQNALDDRGSSFPPQPADASDSAEGEIATALSRTDPLAIEHGQVGTLSAADKVTDAVVPPWTKFADLSIEQKVEQARLMDFEVRDAYLRERCRVAKLEVAYAASALDRATAIIETNLPFFIVHFEEMDAQGNAPTSLARSWAKLSG